MATWSEKTADRTKQNSLWLCNVDTCNYDPMWGFIESDITEDIQTGNVRTERWG